MGGLLAESLRKLFWVALAVLALSTLVGILQRSLSNWLEVLHYFAPWLPPIGMLAVVSLQLDLFSSIQMKNLVNIKARIYDGIHWVMLIALNIGVWMREGVPLWWFALTLTLVTIIGAQIGIGLRNQWQLRLSEKLLAAATASVAFLLGAATGLIR